MGKGKNSQKEKFTTIKTSIPTQHQHEICAKTTTRSSKRNLCNFPSTALPLPAFPEQ